MRRSKTRPHRRGLLVFAVKDLDKHFPCKNLEARMLTAVVRQERSAVLADPRLSIFRDNASMHHAQLQFHGSAPAYRPAYQSHSNSTSLIAI